MTQEGLDKIKKDLAEALAQRPVISAAIAEAREKGDLSENAEYDAAKDEQAELEDRINKLEYQIRNSQIITEADLTGEHVNLGLGVRVKDMKTKKEYVYTIVGITSADPFNGKISNESPVGKALLGKKLGDIVEIQTKKGVLNYKVMEIIK